MAFQKSVVIAACISLCGGFLNFFLVRPFTDREPGRGYGVLILDQARPDRDAGAALTAAGVETYFSESNHWVYLDDFGELLQVPLDEYRDRVEPFDPRNDGYAESLRSFFVRDGMRRFFIPFDVGKGDARNRLAGQVSAALGDTPYTLDFLVHKSSFFSYVALFVVFGAAVLGSLFLSGAPFQMSFLIPLCIPLVFFGPPGLVLTGALFGFSGSLLPLLRGFFVRRRNGGKHPGVFTTSFLMPPVFAAVYGAVVYLNRIPVPTALWAFFLCCGVLAITQRSESYREGHLRFRSVPIRRPALNPRGFFRFFRQHYPHSILPWAPAAVLAMLLLLFVLPGSDTGSGTEFKGMTALNAGDYEAHLVFQRFFSLRSLYQKDLTYSDYYRYSVDKDGLAIETGPVTVGSPNQTGMAPIGYGTDEAFPSFPLADLVGFLEGYTPDENPVRTPGNLISIGLLLIPVVPSLIWAGRKEGRKGNALIINDKRIAA
jgi:hypothetical protein